MDPYAPGGTKYWTAYTFDGLGRTLSVTHPDNTGTTGYLYEGNTVKVTDPAGKWKKFLYDAFGNLTKVTEPNPAGGADHETSYTYNLTNKLTQVSMPRGSVTQTRSFTYAFTTQRLTSTTNPENGTVGYTYNSDGTVASKTKADGLRIEYSYDGYRRVTQVRKYNSLSLEELSQREDFYYDTNPLDPSFTQNGWGRLTAATVGGVQSGPSCPSWVGDSVSKCFSTLYSYTAAGRATQKRLLVTKNLGTPFSPVWDSRYLDAGFTYDNEGRRTSVTYPGTWSDFSPPYVYSPGPTYNYTYDSMGRLNGMWEQQGQQYNWVQDVLYGPSGEMTQMRYADQKYLETRQYNVRGQMTRLKVRDERLSQWSEDIEYRFSATQNNGRITQSKDWVSGEEVTYQYDSLTRLISAATTSNNWGLSFSYDGFGNRTAQTVTKGTGPSSSVVVDGATNRITGSIWLYDYDGNGNMVRMPGFSSLSYDLSNRLASASPSSGGTEYYAYETTNQRVWKKKADGTEEVYFNSPEGEKLRTYTVTGGGSSFSLQMTSASLYFGGKLIWEDGAVVSDRLGSRVKHFPYGEEIQPSPDGVTKFATYYRDSTTALDYAQNRYYSSTQGRFLTPDPYVASGGLESPQSWNKYSYTRGDPVNRYDPQGLQDYDPEGPPAIVLDLGGGGERPKPPGSWYQEQIPIIPGGGGGEPVSSGPPVDVVTNSLARASLNQRLAKFSSTNCARVFAAEIKGYTSNSFVSYVGTTQFYAVRSALFGNLTQDQVVGNGVQTTLNSSVPFGMTAATIWGDNGNAVLLGGNFFSDTRNGQQNTLLHELLHAYTHWEDPDIFAAFKEHGLTRVNPGTSDITDWLARDCKSP